MKNSIVFIGLMVIGLLSNLVHASLMISPTRVVFDERQRTAKVFLINNSQEEKTYRLGWKEKHALPTGGYRDLTPDEVGPWRLSHLIRMTPKQVHLAPGERQLVKLALRRKQGMAVGEYRSHLFFQALPTEKSTTSQAIGINLNMILSYSIPVLYRKNAALPMVKLNGVQIIKNEAKKQFIQVSLQRLGDASTFGKIQVDWKSREGQPWQRVSVANNFAIYPEVQNAVIELNVLAEHELQNTGWLRVSYTGQEEYVDKEFVNKIIALKP
ncbi:molecular chaperone [Pseudoalteromonas luteoviolacea]|uniref:fimbrial biogenesis chaperone n=1 Tax=Pseudoalteromonas luteoviolacea TaxID=43657 RepID=UPI001B366DAC|nr:molecular chaperone [Pseudoalteromonas luteoviolacea]MBQ4813986.1 molecular chaperone [Pseudoalteromonas luteoviolacea]